MTNNPAMNMTDSLFLHGALSIEDSYVKENVPIRMCLIDL